MENKKPKVPQEEIKGLPANALVTREELDKFKELARIEYGVELTDEQAFEQATSLILLFDTLIDKTIAFRKKQSIINNG